MPLVRSVPLMPIAPPGCPATNDMRFTLVLPQRQQSGIHVVTRGRRWDDRSLPEAGHEMTGRYPRPEMG